MNIQLKRGCGIAMSIMFLWLMGLKAFSQSEAYRFKVVKMCFVDKKKKPQKHKWESVENTILVEDIGKSEFRLYTPKELSFMWTEMKELELEADSDTPCSNIFEYTAIDGAGEKCELRLFFFKKKPKDFDLMFMIQYPEYLFTYKIQKAW